MLLHEYLEQGARLSPEKVALVCGERRLTYSALYRSASSLAAFFNREGIRRGDRIVIFLENSPDAVVSIFGTLMAGGCIVVVNPTTPAERLGHLIDDCAASFVIAPSQRLEILTTALRSCSNPPTTLLTGIDKQDDRRVSFDRVIASGDAAPSVGLIDMDLAALIYTSGSTGKQKGVTLTHKNIDVVTDAVAEYLENSDEDIILCVLQLSFGYGLLQLLVTFRTCATLVLEKGYTFPSEMVKRIKEENVTGFAGAPTLYSILLQLKDLDKEDFTRLRYITNAAAALPESFLPRLRKVFPTTKIFLMHGLTEVLRTTYLPPDQLDRRPSSVGRGMKNVELWIEDPDGKRLSSGEVGELVVRGSNVMQGYWNDPEATAKVLLPGRYPWERVMHTGDLFTMDEEGYFYFVARIDDVIKSRGEKVSPLEVENVLYRLDEVLECRVIGVPHPVQGKAVKAEIVLKEGMSLDVKKVRLYCSQHLEDYKVPQIVEIVKSLPKTPGGKIKRSTDEHR